MIYTRPVILSLLFWLSSATADDVMWRCKNSIPSLDNLEYSQNNAITLIKQAPLTKDETDRSYPWVFPNGYDNLGRVKDPKDHPPIIFPVEQCNNPPKRSLSGEGRKDHYLVQFPIFPENHPYPFGRKSHPDTGMGRVIYTWPDKTFCGVVAHPRGTQGAFELCQQCKNGECYQKNDKLVSEMIV